MFTTIQAFFDDRLDAAKQAGTSLPNPPITPEDMAALRAHVGAELPKGLVEFLQLTDGWEDLNMGDVYDATILSSTDIIDRIEDIEDIEYEDEYDRIFPLMFVHEEDTALVLAVDGNKACVVEAHQSVLDEAEPVLDLLCRYTSGDD